MDDFDDDYMFNVIIPDIEEEEKQREREKHIIKNMEVIKAMPLLVLDVAV